MEKKTETSKDKPKGKRGGARPGAGRPKGSRDAVTVAGLLETIYTRSNGQDYEEILVNDFLEARDSHDKQLVLKYHNLILNKMMNTLAKIEVTDSTDAIAAKQAAFAEALAKLTGVKTD
jgi:hypothetical protein